MAYWVLKAILTPVLYLFYRVRVENCDAVPRTGPVILAANHRSFLDSIFLPLVLRRRVTFVAKAEYFDDPKTAWFFRAVGQIPIRREGGSAAEGALAAATDVLEQGGVFAIYPEGTRTRDGYLHRGHTGVARLALATGAADRARRSRGDRRVPTHRQEAAALVPDRVDPFRRAPAGGPLRDRPPRTAWSCVKSPTSSCTRSAS